MSQLFSLPSDSVVLTADDCYTPKWVFDAMGIEFDIDAACPPGGPLHTPAKRYYTAADDGLEQPWDGVTWCNPPYSKFTPWANKYAASPTAVLMGTYAPECAWTPTVFQNSDAVALISCKFIRPNNTPIKPMHGLFVAFRGVGVEPAERLAAADRFGSVLYGRQAA
jgi:hypothetical protein